MSRWQHNICLECWNRLHPGRPAARLVHPYGEICCWCQKANTDGIYIRQDGYSVPCKGFCDI